MRRVAYLKPLINFNEYAVNVLTEKGTCCVMLIYVPRGFTNPVANIRKMEISWVKTLLTKS